MRRSRYYLAVLMGLWALVGGGLGVAAPPDQTLETKRLAVRSALETAPKTGSTPAVGKDDAHAKGRLLVKLRSAASVKAPPNPSMTWKVRAASTSILARPGSSGETAAGTTSARR